MELPETGISPAPRMEFGRGLGIVRSHDDLRPLPFADLAREREVLTCQSSLLCSGWLMGYSPGKHIRSTLYDTDMRL